MTPDHIASLEARLSRLEINISTVCEILQQETGAKAAMLASMTALLKTHVDPRQLAAMMQVEQQRNEATAAERSQSAIGLRYLRLTHDLLANAVAKAGDEGEVQFTALPQSARLM